MTTAAASNAKGSSRFTRTLEISMVIVGLVIGAAFYASLWSPPAEPTLQAAVAPSASSHS